jgi:hypothetical protein
VVAASKKGRRSTGAKKAGARKRRVKKTRTTGERTALIVLGMHRSGTSALTGMLGLAGATLPAHLMPATEANARGFFESQRFFELHEELLAELGTSWQDVSPPPPGFMASPQAEAWVARLADAVEDEFGDASLFVLKDPRICRFVPLWERVLTRVNARPAYFLVLRNPLDVAASLQYQHHIEEGAGLLMWLDHVLRSERDSRGQRRVVISYESLLNDWRRVLRRAEQQTGVVFPQRSRRSEAQIDRFLTSSLRKQRAPANSLEEREDLTNWVKEVYAWGVKADRDDAEIPDVLDSIADAVIEAERAFGPVLASSQLSCQTLRSEAVDLRVALGDARDERNRRDQELSKSRNELAITQGEMAQLREDLEEREGLLTNTRLERNLRGEELVIAQKEAARLREGLDEREIQFESTRQERNLLGDELVVAQNEATRLREGLDEREIQLEDARQERNQREQDFARSAGELALLRDQTSQLRADIENRQEQTDRLFEWVKALVPWTAQLASGRTISPETGAEILAALETAAPSERAAAATAGLRFGLQAARIEELDEDRRRHEVAKAELEHRVGELEMCLAEQLEAHTDELRTLNQHTARLRAEFVVAVERAERRERELVEQAESHAGDVATLTAQVDSSSASSIRIANECAELQEQIAKAHADGADLELYLDQIRQHMAVIKQSRTWRWSRPVRAVAGALRR